MRLVLLLLTFVPFFAFAQVWDKPIAPGVVYRMEVDTVTPRVIHAIKFARDNGKLQALPTLAQGNVFGKDDDMKGRDTLSSTIAKSEALAGINGDFFPWTGDPLGAMVREGELMSRPFSGRSVFAWGPNYSAVARLKFEATMSFLGRESLKIDGVNEAAAKDMLVLNTRSAGYAISEAKSFHAVLDLKAPIAPNGTWTAKVVATFNDETRVPVGQDQAVVTATGKSIEKLVFLSKGADVTIKTSTTGLDWSKALNVVGGGPVIVAEGKPIVASDAEDFNSEFSTKRHPRTAIGHTKSGDIWMVEIEGRQALSAGATIDEVAATMVRLGCVDAINLDGGGSSELALAGMVVNRPSDGTERPVANGILVFGNKPRAAEGMDYVIKGRPKLPQGLATDYKVIDSKGSEVPLSKVVWAATGDAWIDQGGRLRALQPGKSQVKAWIDGKVINLTVTIEPAVAPGTKK